MAIDIHAAFASHPEVKLSKRLAALELAKRADHSGTVRMSYRYLAWRLGCHRRTAMRLIAFLVEDARILRKLVTRLGPAHYDLNVYTFIVKFRRIRAHPYSGDTGDKLPSTPVNPNHAGVLSLREELRRKERTLRLLDLTPGSAMHEAFTQEIARLKGLIEAAEPRPVPPEERRGPDELCFSAGGAS
jgi:hypothetical protein